MGTFSIWHWLIVLAVVLILFGGKGKISALMGDLGKGLKSFKKGMKEDEDDTPAARSIENDPAPTVDATAEKDSSKSA